MSAAHMPVFDLQFREDRRRVRRPCGRALAPEPAQPVAQLSVARLAVEDALDHELGCDGAVPVIFLEAESDVELQLPPKAIELAAEAERDRAAGVARAILDPEPKMLAVADGRDIAQLAAGHEQGDAWIAEPERREARELCAEGERQLRAVDQRIDYGDRPKLFLRQIGVGVCCKRSRKSIDLSRLDREPGRGSMPSKADEMLGTTGEAAVQVEAPDRAPRPFPPPLAPRDQHDRPVIAIDEPGGDDPDDSLVPFLARGPVAPPRRLRLRPGLSL